MTLLTVLVLELFLDDDFFCAINVPLLNYKKMLMNNHQHFQTVLLSD